MADPKEFLWDWGASMLMANGGASDWEGRVRPCSVTVGVRVGFAFARAAERRPAERVELDSSFESALPEDAVESAGSAQAVAAPPRPTAAPMPSATASPPTRPTYSDERIEFPPPENGAQRALSTD